MKRDLLILAAFVGGAISAVVACRVPNADHCLHKQADADEWCANNETDRPYCSPCDSEHHGCVEAQPDAADCPEYSAPDSDGTGMDTGSSGDTGTGTDATDTS